MIHVMSEEEELGYRRGAFDQLEFGSLFDLEIQRFFVVVNRTENEVEVIELTRENCLKITRGEPAQKSKLPFDDMGRLNLRQV